MQNRVVHTLIAAAAAAFLVAPVGASGCKFHVAPPS